MKYLNTKPGSIEELAVNMAKHQNESGYQDMFKKELEKAGKGIGSMTPAEKKAFFNKVDSKYTAKDEATTHTMPDGTVMKGAKHKEEVQEAKFRLEGEVDYKNKPNPEDFEMVVNAMNPNDAKKQAETNLSRGGKKINALEFSKVVKEMAEEDAYDNERFIIIGGKAKIDGGNTPDKKDHVYAPDAKTALQLHKQGKKVYKESIQITADTPEEASMMMRMLQMAGVKSLDQDMINQPDTASSCGGCDENCECGGNCGDDCACGNKTDEDGGFMGATTTPNTKVQDTDTLVNFHSGGLNRQKGTHPKVAGGDNPMQKATENMTDSLRKQYAEFKANYLNAVNEQKKDR